MKKNKLMYSIIALIIIVGIIVVSILRFNFSLEYSESKSIYVYLGKAINFQEIKSITDEVFSGQEVIIKNVDIFNDMISITVKDATDENINSLIQKINEKYSLQLTKESNVTTMQNSYIRGRELISRYIIPIIISGSIILVYLGIRYRKMGFLKIPLKTGTIILVFQALYLSLIAITRLPISKYTIPTGLLVAIITLIILVNNYEEKLLEITTTEKK